MPLVPDFNFYEGNVLVLASVAKDTTDGLYITINFQSGYIEMFDIWKK